MSLLEHLGECRSCISQPPLHSIGRLRVSADGKWTPLSQTATRTAIPLAMLIAAIASIPKRQPNAPSRALRLTLVLEIQGASLM